MWANSAFGQSNNVGTNGYNIDGDSSAILTRGIY